MVADRRRGRLIWHIAWTGAFAVMAAAPPVRAQESGSRPREARQLRVQVTLVGPAGQSAGFDELLVEWLRREASSIELIREPSLRSDMILAPAPTQGVLRIWVVVTSPHQAFLYLADPEGTRFLVREAPLNNGLDEVGREQIAQILLASTQAFLERRASSTRKEVVDSLAAAPPADSNQPDVHAAPLLAPLTPVPTHTTAPVGPGARPLARSEWRARLGASYGVSFRGPEGVGHGPGLLAGVSHVGHRLRWDGTAKGQYQFASTGHGTSMEISTTVVALRLTAAVEARALDWLGVGAELGGGVDYVSFEARRQPGYTPRSPSTDLRPMMLAALRMTIPLRDVRVSIAGGVTCALSTRHYDLVVDGTPRADLYPLPVQPTLGAEFWW
jgi:hypothetical protein